ncbi:steroid hormone receptor ERR2 isoform X2 [Condylostylus longicornis]|nr:steroid hormone receptor ERR2 isoform X2 [Condylostylus longicornis]XP_055381354.1 steroid hormone receptor ERR2 isoform X2 [Condylostylus longicornis]
MTDSSVHLVKQELIIDTSCGSPTPSVGNALGSMNYTSQASPGSPERQFCSSTTTPLGDICGDSSSMHSIKEELPRRLCLVCGDNASGFHYGVASCEACKAFFKRTIQGNIEYTCPANNECEINKRRRKACQACRFQKCLMMGMLKEGVRLDRVRGGRQKYRRNPVSNPYQMQALYQTATSTLDDIKILEVLSNFEPDPCYVGHFDNDDFLSNSNDKSTSSSQATTTTTTSSSLSSSIFDKDKNCMDVHEILSILSNLYDCELVNVIGWAKQIPGFTELPLNDQMKLLQVSWAEILTLQLAYRSLPYNGKLFFASDFCLDERSAKECGAIEFFHHCVQITQRLERLSPSKEEYYLLKALVLSNCDIRLDDQLLLKKFRDTILSAFNDCVYLLRHTAAVSYQQQLLLILPSLRQADNIIRKFWLKVSREENVVMKKLFVEMLESVSR